MYASRKPAARFAAPTACAAGTPRSARVAVRHIGGRLLAVRQDALDGHVIHFGEGAAQHRRHEKESGHSLGIQKFRDKSSAGNLRQSPLPLKHEVGKMGESNETADGVTRTRR